MAALEEIVYRMIDDRYDDGQKTYFAQFIAQDAIEGKPPSIRYKGEYTGKSE